MTAVGVYRIVRAAGILGLVAIALLVPGIGPNRYMLAAILGFVCIPLALLLEIHFPVEKTGWSEPFFDVAMIVILIHLVPDAWFLALLIGTLITGAAGVSASRIGLLAYGSLVVLLISGMTLSAIVHDVENWGLSIIVLMTVFPATLFFIYWEEARVNLLRHRAESLRGLTLVAGGVAHDFNNILTVILGNAELALSKSPQGSATSEELEVVIAAAGQAKMLTQQLLAFSGTDLEIREVVDLESELKSMRRLLEKAMPTGSTLEIHAANGPFHIECHHAQLQQVLMNIIINASEASAPNPAAIRVAVSSQAARDGSGDWVVLEVSDRGPGIAADLLPRIFDPFVSTKPTGHGLGLASAKRILDIHGGHISVESKEDIGTTVRLRFPAREVRVTKLEKRSPQVPASTSGLILVIDDEQQIRTLVSRQLERLGFDAITAADGSAGLRRFREHPALAAVVLDLKMPGMDGWQCLSELRQIRADIPVVIISGHNPTDAPDMADYPNVILLSKPFRYEELANAVTAVTSSGIASISA